MTQPAEIEGPQCKVRVDAEASAKTRTKPTLTLGEEFTTIIIGVDIIKLYSPELTLPKGVVGEALGTPPSEYPKGSLGGARPLLRPPSLAWGIGSIMEQVNASPGRAHEIS